MKKVVNFAGLLILILLSGLVVVLGLVIVFTALSGFAAAKSMAPNFGVYAMIVSVVVTPLVSLITKPFDKEHIDHCFSR